MSNTTERLQVWPALAWDQFPEELVAIDLERGVYFNLGGGGIDVFCAFIQPATIAEVVEQLATTFAATHDELTSAVTSLVKELVDRRLLVPTSDEPPARAPPVAPAERRPLTGFSLQVHEDLQDLIFVDPVHETTDEGWPARKP